jgi:hypothetical protein
MPAKLPAVWAVSKQHFGLAPFVAGGLQAFGFFLPFVALSLHLAAEIEQFDYVYATLRALSFKQAICFWGVTHGLNLISLCWGTKNAGGLPFGD